MQWWHILLICIGALSVFAFALFIFLMKPSAKRRGQMAAFSNVRYAHRGLHGNGIAENSMSAFLAAKKAGYGIELDVRLSKDGELVVFHDDDLSRVTEFRGLVCEKTYAELSEMKLSGTEDTVPLFKDVLRAVDGKVPLLVELKEAEGSYGVAEAAVKILREYDGPYIIESFNPLSLARVKKIAPEVLRGILSQHFTKDEKYKGIKFFLLQHLCLNFLSRPDFVAYNFRHAKMPAFRLAKAFGTPCLAWTTESEEDDAAAVKSGFDGIIFQYYTPELKVTDKRSKK